MRPRYCTVGFTGGWLRGAAKIWIESTASNWYCLPQKSPNLLLVNPSFPAKTVPELLALAKAKPGQYQYASAGNGALNHLLGEMLNSGEIGKLGSGLPFTEYMGDLTPIPSTTAAGKRRTRSELHPWASRTSLITSAGTTRASKLALR